jgi:hypothetical protein
MRLKLLALPLALVATLALVGSQLASTSAQGPGPSAGDVECAVRANGGAN